MAISNIKAFLQADCNTVWDIVVSTEDVSWRSDLSGIRAPGEKNVFIEYTKSGYPTKFRFHGGHHTEKVHYETICETIFEKTTESLCGGFKKEIRRIERNV